MAGTQQDGRYPPWVMYYNTGTAITWAIVPDKHVCSGRMRCTRSLNVYFYRAGFDEPRLPGRGGRMCISVRLASWEGRCWR